jgi:hypothetical protein
MLARACRDAYDALRLEGFTDHQSLVIIGQMIAAANQGEGDGDAGS